VALIGFASARYELGGTRPHDTEAGVAGPTVRGEVDAGGPAEVARPPVPRAAAKDTATCIPTVEVEGGQIGSMLPI
jgi:hypothetical protein